MRLLWLCHMLPSVVRESIGGRQGSGLWMDHVLSDLRRNKNTAIHLLCQASMTCSGKIDEQISYSLFSCKKSYREAPELEPVFEKELESFQPDVIHIWGTEYPHTLAMLRVLQKKNLVGRTVVSIQGLCGEIADAYTVGIPDAVAGGSTLRDFLRQDNIRMQQKKFEQRGKNERQALQIARHVIGRTPWDRALTEKIHPGRQYHFCNETLREPFYTGTWTYSGCTRHRIFASSCVYPIKGFHILLEAAAKAAERFPDLTITVPGKSFLSLSGKDRLREEGYHRYLRKLTKRLGLESKITFLGNCSAEQMRAAFLDANLFVLPSTVENSPNSLGEAMLLGVPCAASDVGGVSAMLVSGQEGLVVPPGDVSALAEAICRVFAQGKTAEAMGRAAHAHAALTHDPDKNLSDLLEIYRRIQAE